MFLNTYIYIVVRTVKLSLKFVTARKLRQLMSIEIAYRQAVNHFIQILWANGNQYYLISYKIKSSRLTAKYLAVAHKHASKVVSTAKINQSRCPIYQGGLQVADQQMLIKSSTRNFDLIVAVSSLKSYQRIHLPLKKTKPLNKLLSYPGAILKTGGIINVKKKQIIFYVEIPDQLLKTEGKILGVDIGLNKLIVDSDGNQYGKDIKCVCQKVTRRKPGSRNKRQARIERDQYNNLVVNQLPWSDIKVLGVERLTGLKIGKKKNQSKQFRRQLAPWSYRQVITKIEQSAPLNRVQVVSVNPAHTSQRCPNCSTVSKDNRNGESFKCVRCGYAADADYVGALNVAARAAISATLGSLKSPELQNN
jgi:IS605 OrfB family transposase